jgi:hypothetical protein
MAGQWLSQDRQGKEEEVVIKALMFDTLGKLDYRDRKLFVEIVKDIFGTVLEDTPIGPQFEKCNHQTINDSGFQENDQKL